LIDKGIIHHLSHCISEEMIADFFTKPQEKHFPLLRDMILNVDSSTVCRSMLANDNSMDVLLKESETDRPRSIEQRENTEQS
jgi:hypothetical protein